MGFEASVHPTRIGRKSKGTGKKKNHALKIHVTGIA
jgi:hypothetical protein